MEPLNPDKKEELPKQTKKNQELARFIDTRLQEMKSYRKQFDENWDTYDRLYLSKPAADPPEDWQANVFVPLTMSTILAILAEITARRTRWKLLPNSPQDESKVDTIMAITDYTLDKGNWDREAFKRDVDKLTYGTSVEKEIYREDRRVIRTRKFTKRGNAEPKEEIITEDVREFNDVYGKHVPLRNFYVDDQCTEIANARDCAERNIVDIRDFKTRYSKYSTSKKVKEWGFLKPSITEAQIQSLPAGGDTNQDGAFLPLSQLKDNQVEVIEYWNKPEDRHTIMANGIIVMDEPIPYEHKQLPYSMDVAIPRPNCAYGIGIPQLLEPSNEEMNTIHNMMIDEGKLDINVVSVVGGMTTLDEDEIQIRPGGVIPVEDVNQWKQVERRGLTQAHFSLYEEIKQTARVASGLDVRFAESSTSSSGDDTATEVIRLQEASLRRIGLLNKMLEINCLPRIGWLRTANIQQFYRDPLKVEMILDDDGNIILDEQSGKPKYKKQNRNIRFQKEGQTNYVFQEITPDQIRGSFDVQIIPQSTQPMSQAVLVKRLNTALQTVLAYPQALEVVDLTELLRQYFKNMDMPSSMVKSTLKAKESGVEQAQQETIDMANGKEVPATVNPSLKHTAVHLAYVYEILQGRPTGQYTQHFLGSDKKAQKAILDHIDGEEKQQAAKGEIEMPSARTPGVQGGMGTQATAQGQEVDAPPMMQ
jgi:hypothetical protein